MVNSCRLLWEVLPDPRSRDAVDAAERFADGEVDREQLAAHHRDAFDADAFRTGGQFHILSRAAGAVAMVVISTHGRPLRLVAQDMFTLSDMSRRGETPLRRHMADLVRDVAGNPFRPAAAVTPEWRTPTVLAVARNIYDGRNFYDLPVLADALQDAGCDDADWLGHCRAPGVHARGCWAVDALLGRA